MIPATVETIPFVDLKAAYHRLQSEIDAAVATVLESGWYILGAEGQVFEAAFARYLGLPHVVGVASGTDAVLLALRACGVGPGDEVITVSHTAVATVAAIELCGAIPRLVDVEPDTLTLAPQALEKAITGRTKAIIPVHLGGWPADMDAMMSLAQSHDLAIIEDCAQAHGATWRGRPVGSMGTVGSFSFCQDKILTTGGEGGLVTTDDEDLFRAMWAYKDHGKSYEAVYEREHPPGFRWLVESFGTNWRMTEMQGAIGRVILRRLDAWVATRTRNATRLLERIARHDALRVPMPEAHVGHAWYKAYAFVRPDALAPGWDRDRIIDAVAAEGVPCFQGSCSEIYLEKAFPIDMRPPERLPVAKTLGETSLMFLVHPTLDDAYIDATADAIDRVMRAASR